MLSEVPHDLFECRDVAAHLPCIVDRNAGFFMDFEQQEISKRRLRAFDLDREHRLLTDKAVEQQAGVGQQRGDRIETDRVPRARRRSAGAAQGSILPAVEEAAAPVRSLGTAPPGRTHSSRAQDNAWLSDPKIATAAILGERHFLKQEMPQDLLSPLC